MIKHIILFSMCIFSLWADIKYDIIGSPYIKQYQNGESIYARNIWDMQLFNGKVYLGAGNSSNKGPAKNAGRVYVVSLNPKNDTFKYEYKIAEEQIDLIKVYDNTLYIPGHDATQKWTYGNIYKKQNNKWKKYRTLPKALHVYDLVVKDEQIFTAVGLYGKGAVFISDEKAKKWQELSQGKGRVYSLLEVGNELFATKTFKKNNLKKLSVTQWNEQFQDFSARFDLNAYTFFPNTKLKHTSIKIIKATKVDDKNLYIGTYKHNDHQNKPFGLYVVSMKDGNLLNQKILLPQDYIPRDIIKRKEKVFVLLTNNQHTDYINKVIKFENSDFSNYKEIISFKYPTFSRSFENFNDCFYFGMGSEIKNPKKWLQEELKKETGDILKVCTK